MEELSLGDKIVWNSEREPVSQACLWRSGRGRGGPSVRGAVLASSWTVVVGS